MRPSLLSAALAMAVMSMSATADDTRITLYSGDFDSVSQAYAGPGMPGLALVSQSLDFPLKQGDNVLDFDRLPLALDTGTVQFSSSSGKVGVGSQRYDFALAGQDELLRRAIGQRVVVEQGDGSALRRIEGVLLSAGNGLTLKQDDGRIRVLANYAGFELPALPEGVATRPTLRWQVSSPSAGRERFQLDYATGGLAWNAEYTLVLADAKQNCRMSLDGAAQVVNRSGVGFPAASLTLVAGNPNQVRQAAPQAKMMMAARGFDAPMMESAPEPVDSGEYHAYPLKGQVQLPDGSVQRVPLIAPLDNVACTRRYEVQSGYAGYRPARPQVQPNNGETTLPVSTTLAFTNGKTQGLGMPLPAGRVRVFQHDAAGRSLLGEARLSHTAANQDVRLDLGEAFDLSATRTARDFRLDDNRLSLTETVEFKLKNAKREAVALRLHEALPRWQDWEIVETTAKWEKEDAQSIRFDVTVPAEGETTVRYTVRYRWPLDVRP
jgi:hypothetical protein